jgi:hypothetical protein
MFGCRRHSAVTPGINTAVAHEDGAVATAAEWAALSYRVEGVDAQIKPLGPATAPPEVRLVVVPSLRRVECVVDDESDFSAVARELEELRQSGWGVWVLTPLRRLGDAHIAFRAEADYVQGWWVRPDRSVTFTAPQIP